MTPPNAVAPPRKKILLTGFDAFGGAALNPSWLAVKALHGRQMLGHTVVAAQLPTVFDASLRELRALLQQHQPALVVCVGQAGGRQAISLERVAINVNDAPIADNAGAQPVDTPVAHGAPVAYFTSLPIKAMLAALQTEGVRAEVSQTAGTFVCNHVFYGLMRELATQPQLRHTRGGFVHVPWLPEQGTPHMALDDIVRGLRAALRCALQVQQDQALGAGTTH
ncbi:MAG: pyroglutamyl-peptidase I [Hydrogenophaga sp.]|jgi:pyroglutamyl-peptidase|uniref:pyroglutamyl-peptidase I n=3 Tax=Hydrogenophaga sp. TaxID=1904254 RepID=UPI001E0231B9|nr:pyroglutamyl-peptidase I [Hydrogenophaga sp.]MBW0171525.1 pyroglutamyl-peptidase I [Hydrogenophaga sp.]MBW0185131.1 pyroglutamyl-peptidase I [Hydrogenophaga sp.]